MRIRKVDTDDERVRDIIHRLHDATFPADAMPGLHGDWWLVEGDGQPVGFAGMWTSLSLPGAGYLCRAGVLPVARGQGLQRRLIGVRQREAKRKGWNALVTDTSYTNHTSANNLIRAGFKLYKPAYNWSFPDALYWRKIIGDAG